MTGARADWNRDRNSLSGRLRLARDRAERDGYRTNRIRDGGTL